MRGDLFNITGRQPGQSPLNTHWGRGRSQWISTHRPERAHDGLCDYYYIILSARHATLNDDAAIHAPNAHLC
jgi:hypothetical protein